MSDYENLMRQERRKKMWVLHKSVTDEGKYVCSQDELSDILEKNAINNGRVVLKKDEHELIVKYILRIDEAVNLEKNGYTMLKIKEFKEMIIMEREEETMIERMKKEKDFEKDKEELIKKDTDTDNLIGTVVSGAVQVEDELISKTIMDLDKKVKEKTDILELLKNRYNSGWRIYYKGVRFDYSNKKAVRFEVSDPEVKDGFTYREASWTQTFEDINYNGINISRMIDYTGFVLSEVQLLRYEMTKLLSSIRFKEREYDIEDDKYTLILDFYDNLKEVLQSKDNNGLLKYSDSFIISAIAGETYVIIKSRKFNCHIYKELEPVILFDGTAKKMIDFLQGAHVLKEMESRKRTIPVANYYNSCYCISIKRINEIRKMVKAYESEKIQ